MSPILTAVVAASPAILFLAAPFLGSAALALTAAVLQRHLKADAPFGPAGPWAADQAEAAGLAVRVAVSAEITGSMDGYWPRPGIVGLSPRTWVDRSLAGRMIAAHELGHASLWAERPAFAEVLARARQVHRGASVLAGSGFLVGALMDSAAAVDVGFLALAISLFGGVGVLVDEVLASRSGARLLERTGHRTRATDAAMTLAAAVYALPMGVHALFLAHASAFSTALLQGSPVARHNSDLGLWAILLLAPFLALRAVHVVVDAREASPTLTEFRLNWNLFQERSWEFHSSVIVLLWLFLTYDEPVSAGLAPLFVLGALPAMTTLGAIGRLVVVMPLVTVLALAGFYGRPSTARSPTWPAPVEARELLDPTPDPLARAAGWLRIAWVPLMTVLVVRAIQGW